MPHHAAHHRPTACPSCANATPQILGDTDTNGDGVVDFDEFKALMLEDVERQSVAFEAADEAGTEGTPR